MDIEDESVERYCSDVILEIDEYVVYTFDHDQSTDYQRMVFDDPSIAGNFKQGSRMLNSMQREIVNDIIRPTSFLDKMVDAEQKSPGGSKNLPAKGDENMLEPMPPSEMMFGMAADEFEKKFKKIKKKLKKKREELEEKAKTALLEAAKLYLGEKHVPAYEKYKLELNKSGLASIMYQMHTMRDALDSMSARIRTASSALSTRDIDSFVGLQRIMLDVQKFQFEFMESVEVSMKELKLDLEIAEHGQSAAPTDGSDNILFFKGSKDFIKQLGEFKNSMRDFQPTKSKNIKLNPEAEIVDIAHEEATGGLKIGDGGITTKNPFGDYDGAPKRKKKQRNEEGEEGEDDSFDI